MNLNLSSILILFVAFGVAVVLSESYMFLDHWIRRPWLSAAIVHSVLSVGVLFLLRRKLIVPPKSFGGRKHRAWWFYLPSLVVVVGCLAIASVSALMIPGSTTRSDFPFRQLAWVLWIPVVEELVFRVGCGSVFRKYLGCLWGSYLSVLLFSFVHSLPTLSRVWAGSVGFTLGTLLLGVMCELIWHWSGRVGPIVAFHSVCNGTVVLFALIDGRWLGWLSGLYL